MTTAVFVWADKLLYVFGDKLMVNRCPLLAPFPVKEPPIPLIIVCDIVLSVTWADGVPNVPPPDPVAAAA